MEKILNLRKNKSPGTLVTQNFPEACEVGINDHINRELYASYVYLSMSYYFDRDDVALPRCANFFKNQSDEEMEHAEKFMKFQNKRGGKIVFKNIEKPVKDDWKSLKNAVKNALELEKKVNDALLELRKIAEDNLDVQTCDFLDNELLRHQLEEIKMFADMSTNAQLVGSGLGEYIFDKFEMNREDS